MIGGQVPHNRPGGDSMAKDQDDVEDVDTEDDVQDDGTEDTEDSDKGKKKDAPADDDADEAKLPAWAQKELTRARKEAAKHRTSAKGAEAAALKKFAKALGLDGDGDLDPEKLKSDLESERSKAKTAAIELAVVRRAGKAKADSDALLDSTKFLRSVAELDPADEDFGAQVDAAIREAVQANPKLGAQAARAGKGGGEFGGGSGGSGSGKGKEMSMDDVYNLVRKKRT